MGAKAGSKLGPYEILSLIGAGGMGEVYKARDSRLNRTVAIKIISAEVSSNADLRARFEREAPTLASLNHPHINLYSTSIRNSEGPDFTADLPKLLFKLRQTGNVGSVNASSYSVTPDGQGHRQWRRATDDDHHQLARAA